jgi:Spy/CpxP family protein refolding chaperone
MSNASPKTLTIAVLLLLIINTGLVVFLVLGRKEKSSAASYSRQDNFELMAKELNLQEEQKAQHKLLREEHFKNVKPYYDSIRTAKTALYGRIADTTITTAEFDAYDAKASQWHSAINRLTFEHFKKVRALLQPAQQADYDKFIQKMMQRNRRDSSRKD